MHVPVAQHDVRILGMEIKGCCFDNPSAMRNTDPHPRVRGPMSVALPVVVS